MGPLTIQVTLDSQRKDIEESMEKKNQSSPSSYWTINRSNEGLL